MWLRTDLIIMPYSKHDSLTENVHSTAYVQKLMSEDKTPLYKLTIYQSGFVTWSNLFVLSVHISIFAKGCKWRCPSVCSCKPRHQEEQCKAVEVHCNLTVSTGHHTDSWNSESLPLMAPGTEETHGMILITSGLCICSVSSGRSTSAHLPIPLCPLLPHLCFAHWPYRSPRNPENRSNLRSRVAYCRSW